MTQHTNEKSPAPAATGNEGNKSIEERSTTTAYLAYYPDNTRDTFGTWGGDDLEGRLAAIYARVDAEAQTRLDEEGAR